MTPCAFVALTPLPATRRAAPLHAPRCANPATPPRRVVSPVFACVTPPAPAPPPSAARAGNGHAEQQQQQQQQQQGGGAAARRCATVTRTTKETSVSVTVDLDGTGVCDVHTGIPFLDHMLNQLSSHGLVDLRIRAQGDLWIDDHHTNEDVAITLGMAIAKALGDKKGIRRFGHFVAPLDESLVEVALDFSGRPYVQYGLQIPTERVGKYDTQLVREFFFALAGNAQMTLHLVQKDGVNSHHIIEACFKAFARAVRMAVEMDPRRLDAVPSSKGVLTDDAALRK